MASETNGALLTLPPHEQGCDWCCSPDAPSLLPPTFSPYIQVASETNGALLTLPPHEQGWEQVDVGAMLATIGRELRSDQEATRLEALRWVHFLLLKAQTQVGKGRQGTKWRGKGVGGRAEVAGAKNLGLRCLACGEVIKRPQGLRRCAGFTSCC